MGRLPCSSNDDGGMKKRLWTADEDALLAKCVQENGEGRWRHIPRKAGLLRCGKSCRMRWVNYLRPNLKRGNITKDEADLIVRLHKLLGNRWSIIAGRVPGRTDNDIKNYWNTHLTKKSVTNRGTTSRKEMNSVSPDFQLEDELRKRDSHQQHSCNEDPVGEHAEAACLQENIISNLDNSARTVPNLTCQERVEISQVDYFTSPGVTTFNAFCEPVTRSRLLAFPSSCLESNMELELAPPPSLTVPSKNMIGEAEHYYRKGYASHDEYKQKWLCATAGDHPNITDGAAMLYQMDTIQELNRNYPSEPDDDKSVDSVLGASSILRPPEHDTQHKMLNVFQSMDLMVSSPESTQFNIHEPEINEQELIIFDLWSFL